MDYLSTTSYIRRHISGLPARAIFPTRSLLVYGRRATVDKSLSRLAAKGKIVRVTRGLYMKCSAEEKHPLPSIEEVARIKARAFGREIFAHGSTVAKQFAFNLRAYSIQSQNPLPAEEQHAINMERHRLQSIHLGQLDPKPDEEPPISVVRRYPAVQLEESDSRLRQGQSVRHRNSRQVSSPSFNYSGEPDNYGGQDQPNRVAWSVRHNNSARATRSTTLNPSTLDQPNPTGQAVNITERVFAVAGRTTSFMYGNIRIVLKGIAQKYLKLGDTVAGLVTRGLLHMGRKIESCWPLLNSCPVLIGRQDNIWLRVAAWHMPWWLSNQFYKPYWTQEAWNCLSTFNWLQSGLVTV